MNVSFEIAEDVLQTRMQGCSVLRMVGLPVDVSSSVYSCSVSFCTVGKIRPVCCIQLDAFPAFSTLHNTFVLFPFFVLFCAFLLY